MNDCKDCYCVMSEFLLCFVLFLCFHPLSETLCKQSLKGKKKKIRLKSRAKFLYTHICTCIHIKRNVRIYIWKCTYTYFYMCVYSNMYIYVIRFNINDSQWRARTHAQLESGPRSLPAVVLRALQQVNSPLLIHRIDALIHFIRGTSKSTQQAKSSQTSNHISCVRTHSHKYAQTHCLLAAKNSYHRSWREAQLLVLGVSPSIDHFALKTSLTSAWSFCLAFFFLACWTRGSEPLSCSRVASVSSDSFCFRCSWCEKVFSCRESVSATPWQFSAPPLCSFSCR